MQSRDERFFLLGFPNLLVNLHLTQIETNHCDMRDIIRGALSHDSFSALVSLEAAQDQNSPTISETKRPI